MHGTSARFVGALICAAVSNGCAGAARQPGHVSLDAACTVSGNGQARINVTFLNGSAEHVSIVVGVVLGDGDHLAEALSLRLKTPGAVESETYGFSHPRHPGVAGRMDRWRLEVPSGGLTSLVVDAQHFLSPTSGRRLSGEERGELSVRFRGLNSKSWAGHELSRPWIGIVESEPIRVPESCYGG